MQCRGIGPANDARLYITDFAGDTVRVVVAPIIIHLLVDAREQTRWIQAAQILGPDNVAALVFDDVPIRRQFMEKQI